MEKSATATAPHAVDRRPAVPTEVEGQTIRYLFIVLLMLLGSMTSAVAQISIGIGLPGVSIGINFPLYPELVQVPGYPVYYAPRPGQERNAQGRGLLRDPARGPMREQDRDKTEERTQERMR